MSFKHLDKVIAHNKANPEKRKTMQMTYHKKSTGRLTKRRIDPYEVKGELLYAYDHKRKALRSFRMERIRSMEKSAFWLGFEKEAVSQAWVNRKVINGLASRASKAKDSLPQMAKATGLNKDKFGYRPGTKAPWRKGQDVFSKVMQRHYVNQINNATKGKPHHAQKMIDKMHDIHMNKKIREELVL